MENLTFSLLVALIGILVVFTGLVILIGCVKVITFASGEHKKKPAPAAPKAEPVPAAPVAQAGAPVVEEGVSPEIIAAITAAIASVWEGQSGFVVRHVKRVSNASAWNRAGRDDQVYSRM